MEPLPFFSLVRTRGVPGFRSGTTKPEALGIVLGRAEGFDGWHYSVMVGESCWDFKHDELIPLGWTIDRNINFGRRDELEAVPAEDVMVFVGRGD